MSVKDFITKFFYFQKWKLANQEMSLIFSLKLAQMEQLPEACLTMYVFKSLKIHLKSFCTGTYKMQLFTNSVWTFPVSVKEISFYIDFEYTSL